MELSTSGKILIIRKHSSEPHFKRSELITVFNGYIVLSTTFLIFSHFVCSIMLFKHEVSPKVGCGNSVGFQ